MIQDIAPKRLDNHYDPALSPKPEDFCMVFLRDALLCCCSGDEGTLCLPTVGALLPAEGEELLYLFSIDEERFFLYRGEIVNPPEGFSFIHMTELRRAKPRPSAYVFAAFTAVHLAEWYRKNRYCGACGKPLQPDERERAMKCPSCGNVIYPRINPAVIVGVRNRDRLLITRYREGYRHNALVAGFAEIGEMLEQTVAREVYEETGLQVKNIRYYKSQPWGIAADLLAGFFCDVDGDDTIRMDREELRYAAWTARDEIELQPSDYSLTNEMMQRFREGNA